MYVYVCTITYLTISDELDAHTETLRDIPRRDIITKFMSPSMAHVSHTPPMEYLCTSMRKFNHYFKPRALSGTTNLMLERSPIVCERTYHPLRSETFVSGINVCDLTFVLKHNTHTKKVARHAQITKLSSASVAHD